MSVFAYYSNLSDYTVEFSHEFDSSYIDYIVRLCEPYSVTGKAKPDNYAPERLKQMFTGGRFQHGFYVVKHRGNAVLTFGVDDFEGWGVLTRYLRHTNHNHFIPFVCGIGIPFLKEHLKNQTVALCWTQNLDQKSLADARHRFQVGTEDNIYSVAANTAKSIKQLDFNVMYRSVIQTAYTIDTELTPPFIKYVQTCP
jgi:hypothetical protein